MSYLMVSPERWDCTTYDGYVESTPAPYLGFAPPGRWRSVTFNYCAPNMPRPTGPARPPGPFGDSS